MTLPVLSGLGVIARDYDGFIIDLWGVLHDGVTAYPGAADALRALKAQGKKVVLLSNSPRRAEVLIELMRGMGMGPELYDALVSSGEATWEALSARRDPWYAALGRRCLLVGPERDRPLMDGLDLIPAQSPDEADFLLNTGPDLPGETLADYLDLLDRALLRGVKMVCANPDLVVVRAGRELLCAGALAAYYAEKGGDVRYVGKPHPAIYERCFDLLGLEDRRRILAIGDAFHTDMAGAARTGIDGLFVSGGIHAEELETRYGEAPCAERLAALAALHPETRPVAALGGFSW